MNQLMLIQVLGIFFVLFGITIRLGYWKKMYFSSRGGIYGYVPMGLLFILYTYYEEVSAKSGNYLIYYYVVFGLLIVGILLLSLRKPRWMKPAWVIWVEKYPEKVIKAMADDVKNNPEWEKNTVSEEAVDYWAKSLKHK